MDIPEEHKSLVEDSSEWNYGIVRSEPKGEKDKKVDLKKVDKLNESSDNYVNLANKDHEAKLRADIESKVREEIESKVRDEIESNARAEYKAREEKLKDEIKEKEAN